MAKAKAKGKRIGARVRDGVVQCSRCEHEAYTVMVFGDGGLQVEIGLCPDCAMEVSENLMACVEASLDSMKASLDSMRGPKCEQCECDSKAVRGREEMN